VQYTASLRVIGESNTDRRASSGTMEGTYTQSNNVLYKNSLGNLERICKAIKDNGTVDIQGKVVDAMKPVLDVDILNSLPIMYKTELSGDPSSGCFPGWVLRAELDGTLLMLWGSLSSTATLAL
jgi:hypothetical protein